MFLTFVVISYGRVVGLYIKYIFNFVPHCPTVFVKWQYHFPLLAIYKSCICFASSPAIYFFVILKSLVDTYRYLFVLYIWIFLIINDAKHFLMCLFDIYSFFCVYEVSVQNLCSLLLDCVSYCVLKVLWRADILILKKYKLSIFILWFVLLCAM